MTASNASARIESRRKPPLLSSPGPRRSRSPISASRAIAASAAPFTSAARRRVISPSSARGCCSKMSSATIRLTSASPRNSSRSLLYWPALRCVSACASSSGFANGCPSARDASLATGVAQKDRLVEHRDEIDVVHEVDALLVGDAQGRAAGFALELDRLRRHGGLVAVLRIELRGEVAG